MSKVRAFAFLVCALFMVSLLGARTGVGQCLPHPEWRTVVLFANETSFELTFFIDEDETGIAVPSKAVSPEQSVEPGGHMFRARAMVDSKGVWVWVINDVPTGHVCTWTITDPARFEPHELQEQTVVARNFREQ